jgi:porin
LRRIQPALPLHVRVVRCAAFIVPLSGAVLPNGSALAQSPGAPPTGQPGNSAPAAPAERNNPVPGQTGSGEQAAGASTGFWDRSNLFGTLGGLCTVLDGYGMSLGLADTGEVLGNPTGGRARGAVFEGVTAMSVGADLEKAIGLRGGILNASAFQIHGRGLSTNNVDNLNTVSNIEADRSTRLFELWYQQAFLDGKVDVKIGQQSADLEFMITQYGGLFINATFGWAGLPTVDLPSGGNAYPLGTPGIRLRAQPSPATTVLFGVFNGSPAGIGLGDPQLRDRAGTNFDLNSGVFIIGEVQYALNPGDAGTGLAGTYKLGAWYNSDAFTDQFYTVGGTTAASAFSNPPGARKNDWSAYAVVDQLIYRSAGSKDGGAGVFARAMGAPGDRNTINVFVDGGFTYKGAFGRANDTTGLGVQWARISDTARRGDSALAAFTGGHYPIRTSETMLEATYQAQLAPWWFVQPDIQYVLNPGGGILNPSRPDKRLADAIVFGIRTSIVF